ncbi:MAG: LysR family transcriptional regulator [Pseudomonadota bacterium]
MDKWTELRTAYYVAKHGTVSAASEALGLHRASIIRHIDILEGELGGKIFLRHAKGYTMTDAGKDLLQIASATEDQFKQLAGRTRGRSQEVSGELIVTSPEALSEIVVPALGAFRRQHPRTSVRYLVNDRTARLEYGEAHVAIRGGSAPNDPDNVVRRFILMQPGLYAHQDYVAAHGRLGDDDDIRNHAFVERTSTQIAASLRNWMREKVPPQNIVLKTADGIATRDAIRSGIGIGFLPKHFAEKLPDLVEMRPSIEAWSCQTWLVTHVDLNRSAKVQSILKLLNETLKAEQPVAA